MTEMPVGYLDIMLWQGWNEKTLLDLCLEYIGNQQDDDTFIEFLQAKADLENAT